MHVDEALAAGHTAEEAGDLVGAAAAFSSLLDHDEARVAATAKLHLARIEWRRGQHDAALSYCTDARSTAIRIGDHDLRARIENSMGVLHVARAEYAQAKAAYVVALELTKDTVTRAKISLNLGVIANIQGTLDVARRHYSQSLALFREADDDRGEALALHNLGMLHSDLKEWDEADEAFREALALFEQHGNQQMIGNVLVNRSEVTYGRGRIQDAIAQCDLAMATYAEIGDETGRSESLKWKAHGLRLLGRFGAAATALNEAVRISQRINNKLIEAESTRELALVYKADNRPREAANAFTRALEAFRDLGATRDAEEVEAELRRLGPG